MIWKVYQILIERRMKKIMVKEELLRYLEEKEKEVTWYKHEYKGDTEELIKNINLEDIEIGPIFGWNLNKLKNSHTLEDLKSAIYQE